MQVIDIIWGYLIILLSNTVLEGLLRIHVVLFDPFGEDACDFPVQQLLDYTWESSHAFLQHAQDLPQMTLDVCNSDLLKKINASDDEDDGD